LQEVYCPSCSGDIVVAEIPEEIKEDVKNMHAVCDSEASASALLLLIASGAIEAKKWTVEDGREALVDFKPTIESLKEDYSEEIIIKGLKALGRLRAFVLPGTV